MKHENVRLSEIKEVIVSRAMKLNDSEINSRMLNRIYEEKSEIAETW